MFPLEILGLLVLAVDDVQIHPFHKRFVAIQWSKVSATVKGISGVSTALIFPYHNREITKLLGSSFTSF